MINLAKQKNIIQIILINFKYLEIRLVAKIDIQIQYKK